MSGNGNGRRTPPADAAGSEPTAPLATGDPAELTDEDLRREARPQFGKLTAAGMPLERSKDFRSSSTRLLSRLRPERLKVAFVLVCGIASVTLLVFGPRILGRATNIVVGGVVSGEGIDFQELHRTLA